MARASRAAPYASLEQQAHAARLGVWVFLASELMFFGAFLGLYAGLRCAWPAEFRKGVAGDDVALGTLNTYVLLTSSLLVALALAATRAERPRATAGLLAGSVLLGGAFLAVKAVEWAHHLASGARPGAGGPGLAVFHDLYFGATGLHALHVVAGMSVLAWLAARARSGDFGPARDEHVALELGGLYWHLVDIVWIFLWPIFYLLGDA